jgi:hypothetical protein
METMGKFDKAEVVAKHARRLEMQRIKVRVIVCLLCVSITALSKSPACARDKGGQNGRIHG